ncbi:DUF305 domain-containing protein [Micromonospora sp. CPCC 205539]|uniref:DUF305 domain-containing protein n=1 Tax=Micromonospora sp. CPCC 205539 TaxID=3122408 RepID=UPI002FF2A0F7
MTVRRGWLLTVVISAAVVLVLVMLAVRAADDPARPAAGPALPTPTAATPTGPAAPPVIVPGRPGETATARPAHEVRDDSAPRYNALDTTFVQMMIPHHQQALEMTQLAADRAADPRIRAFADRIRAGQGPEVGVLRGWLTARGLPAETPGHDHGGMRGMQTPEAMRALAGARGVEFDRLFVRMMTEHHQGAVTMATDLLSVGVDQTLNELATSLATEQAIEITRLRALTPR